MFLLFGGSGYRPLLGNILYCVELNGFEKNQRCENTRPAVTQIEVHLSKISKTGLGPVSRLL